MGICTCLVIAILLVHRRIVCALGGGRYALRRLVLFYFLFLPRFERCYFFREMMHLIMIPRIHLHCPRYPPAGGTLPTRTPCTPSGDEPTPAILPTAVLYRKAITEGCVRAMAYVPLRACLSAPVCLPVTAA